MDLCGDAVDDGGDEPWRPSSPPAELLPLFCPFSAPPSPVSAVAASLTQGFFAHLKWSADGLQLFALGQDRSLVSFAAPADTWDARGAPAGFRAPALVCREAEPIYDVAAFPSPEAPQLVAVTARAQPVHLYASLPGDGPALRASYCGAGAGDEPVSALSLAFSACGEALFAGLERRLLVFDTSRPGREAAQIAMSPTRRSPHGQKGIIGALDAAPGGDSSLLACGSYVGTVGLYDTRSCAAVCALRRGRAAEEAACGDGVTQVAFSPDGLRLFAGFRRGDGCVRVWDLRYTHAPLPLTFRRDTSSFQRIGFSLDRTGACAGGLLLTGSRGGEALAYRTDDAQLLSRLRVDPSGAAVNAAALHPFGGAFACAVGERVVGSGGAESGSGSDEASPAPFEAPVPLPLSLFLFRTTRQ